MAAFTIRASFAPTGRGLRFTLFDDAMISMGYARTLVETGEWVWFPGADRVQGITNPLWTLYMALIHALGLEGSSAALAVSVTGIACLLSSGVVVGHLVQLGLATDRHSRWAAYVAGGTVPLTYPLVYWSLRGMEVGLLALLSLVATLAVWSLTRSHDQGWSSTGPILCLVTTGATGVAVRLDFIFILGPLLLLTFLWAPNKRMRVIILGMIGIPLVIATISILAFQSAYWGDYLPNTYRLKVEGFTTKERLTRGLSATAKSIPLVTLAITALLTVRSLGSSLHLQRLSLLLAVVSGSPIAYSIWTGGDSWEHFLMLNRYVSVGVPALIALLFLAAALYVQQEIRNFGDWQLNILMLILYISTGGLSVLTDPSFAIDRKALLIAMRATTFTLVVLWISVTRHEKGLGRSARRFAAPLAISLVTIAATSSYSGYVWLSTGAQYTNADHLLTDIGFDLRLVSTPEAVVATHTAGAQAYYAQRPMVDLLGKNDRVIATGPPAENSVGERVAFNPGHSKYDSTHSIKNLTPDIVLGEPWDIDESQMAAWGYSRYCGSGGLRFYALSSSSEVLFEKLTACS